MAIGMGIEDFGHSVDESVVNAVLQGLACGTFFYVTFFEVLPHELNQGKISSIIYMYIYYVCVCVCTAKCVLIVFITVFAGGDRLLKLLAILLGFSAICGVMFLDPDAAPNGGSCPRIT